LGKANSPSLTAEFPAQEKTKSTSLKIETLSQYIYVTNEGNLGRSIYMLKLAQAESDFGLKSQHDDTSQKTNLKTNPKVKLKLSNETMDLTRKNIRITIPVLLLQGDYEEACVSVPRNMNHSISSTHCDIHDMSAFESSACCSHHHPVFFLSIRGGV